MSEDKAAVVDGLEPGTFLYGGAFEILKPLGQGGFGITYLARQRSFDRLVAVKEFYPGGAARRIDGDIVPTGEMTSASFDKLRSICLREAQALARFDHPNIVSIHDYFEEGGTVYLVLQYLEGQSLDYLAPMKTQGEVEDWLFPIMDALEVIHEAGLLHRDISPENIMIRNTGVPVLLDFGAAKLGFDSDEKDATRSLGRKKSSFALVKDGYAPIEQYAAGTNQNESTDIYALAATAYYMITQEPPVPSHLRSMAMNDGDPDPLTPLSEFSTSDFSSNFLSAIEYGMGVRKKDRPRNIAEWRGRLISGPDAEQEIARPSFSPKPTYIADPEPAYENEADEYYDTQTQDGPSTAGKAAGIGGAVALVGLIILLVISQSGDEGDAYFGDEEMAVEAMSAEESDSFTGPEAEFHVIADANLRARSTGQSSNKGTFKRGDSFTGRPVEGVNDASTRWVKVIGGSHDSEYISAINLSDTPAPPIDRSTAGEYWLVRDATVLNEAISSSSSLGSLDFPKKVEVLGTVHGTYAEVSWKNGGAAYIDWSNFGGEAGRGLSAGIRVRNTCNSKKYIIFSFQGQSQDWFSYSGYLDAGENAPLYTRGRMAQTRNTEMYYDVLSEKTLRTAQRLGSIAKDNYYLDGKNRDMSRAIPFLNNGSYEISITGRLCN